MADLATLQAQLDKLRTARASGVLRVTEGLRTVEYKTTDDIEKAIDRVVQDIARLMGSAGTVVPSRVMRSITSKGT